MSNLSDVSILLRTFLRDEKLFNSISAIRKNMPEMRIIIVDDGEMTEEKDGVYSDLIKEGHKVIILDFDSGLGAKSNAATKVLDTKFLLVSCDDFSHSPPSVAVGIEKMLGVLDREPELAIASGRVNNKPYEFHLAENEDDGSVYELEALHQGDKEYYECGLTVNYSLIRSEVFQKVRWLDSVPIGGGEHAAFFLAVKYAGFKVAWVPGVNITTQEGKDSDRYIQFRRRALSPERPCFDAMGVKRYVMASGQIDYEKKA
jgi:Glycosyl transferase family 2